MNLQDWFKVRTQYQIRARDRADERRNIGDDSEFWVRVIEEMLMDIDERLTKIEDVLFDKSAKRK